MKKLLIAAMAVMSLNALAVIDQEKADWERSVAIAKATNTPIPKFERKSKQGVRIGMTKEDVLASSWGKPARIHKSTYSFGVHEQWAYSTGNYLFFENGRLTSIHN